MVEYLTGIRPTGTLTLGNYLGSIKPILHAQQQGQLPYLFIADFHALSTNEGADITEYRQSLILDLLAAGFDPNKGTLYIQSHLANELLKLQLYLSRFVSAAELTRQPALKEKARGNPDTANMALVTYPILMAADILIMQAKTVPVGRDQLAHLELTRVLAERFNKTYQEVFPLPKALEGELKILSLTSENKMSKSEPQGAILLSDTPEIVAKKIAGATTASPGQMSDNLDSLFLIASLLDSSAQFEEFKTKHLNGDPIMKEFKDYLTNLITAFLADFQSRRQSLESEPEQVTAIINQGNSSALTHAKATLALVENAMHFHPAN